MLRQPPALLLQAHLLARNLNFSESPCSSLGVNFAWATFSEGECLFFRQTGESALVNGPYIAPTPKPKKQKATPKDGLSA